MASIRLDIGTDYPTYWYHFERIKSLDLNNLINSKLIHFEPLFHYTISSIKILIKSPIFIFSFWALVTLIFIWIGIKYNSPNFILSIFIYYCCFFVNYQFNGIRQGVAMGMFLYSIKYIINRKFKSVSIISLIASMIHISGLFILLSYFLDKINIKSRITMISMIIVSLLIWKIGIGEYLFTSIIDYIPGIVLPNMEIYFKIYRTQHTYTQVLQRLLIIIPMIYFNKKLDDSLPFKIIFNIYFYGTIFYLMFGFFGLFVTRINMFFRILEILLIPIIYERIKSKNQKILALTIISSWGFIVLSWVYYKEAYYPFKTIFGAIF